ncbi:MAG: hypothetical protein GWQ05_03230 [Verrucomicrobiaceae bacterium]|nr:hypothetical protein [Verrucomicrobiaceae bacterium]
MKEHLNISWKFLLALIVIFVSGKVVGYAIAVHRDTSVSAPPASPPALETNAWSAGAMERLTVQLGLTSDQLRAIEPIVARSGEKILKERERALFQIHLQLLETHDEISIELRPDQLEALAESQYQLKEAIATRFTHIIEPNPQAQ